MLRSLLRRSSSGALAGMMAVSIALGVAACGGGLPATPRSSATPTAAPATPSDAPAVTARATATPGPASPTPSPAPTEVAGPPSAALVGVTHAGAGPLPGAPGTFTWDGLTSDSPWIVPSAGGNAGAGSPLAVTFDPAGGIAAWRVRWAPVRSGDAGTPIPGGGGDGAPVTFAAPDHAGAWSLVVEGTFARDNKATWFWLVQVAP